MKLKYRKNDYYMTDNDKFIIKKEYIPETITIKELNPITEAYEYKEKTINHKLNWENTAKAIENSFLMVKKEINKE